MANGRISGPNVQLARFVFDNTWSVDRLEAYATSYYPDGIPLRTLRHGLGHHRVPLHQYAQTLVKFATLSSLGRYVFGSEISYNKPPPRLPGLGC
jgi:hypothetical protein